MLAYNLGNLWRRLVLPPRIKRWSLTSLQQRLVKTGGRLVKHARYYWLLLAEGHLTRRLFGDMLRRIWALPVPAGGRAAECNEAPWAKKGHKCGAVSAKCPESRVSNQSNVGADSNDGLWSCTIVRRTEFRALGGSRVV